MWQALTESPQPNVGGEPTAGLGRRFWALVPLVGVSAGAAAGLLMKLLRLVQHLAWPAYHGDFLAAVEASSAPRHVLVLLAAGVLVSLTRALLRQPTGGHSAELTETIWFHAGRLPLARTLVRAVESIVIVGLGASLGREAAPKQAGAGFASVLALRAGLPPGQRRLLVAYGAGAGMAAVYNVPLGGALFALEVLLGTLALPLVAPALATSILATATAWLILGERTTYHLSLYPVTAALLLWSALAGPLAGLASVAYVRLISRADALRPRSTLSLIAAPLAAFLALGALSLAVPQLLGNGRSVVQLALTGELTLASLALVTLLKPLATAACLGSGAPGGLFTPTLTLGAALGALLGHGASLIGLTAPTGACALIAAVAVLAASMQGPVSAIVLVLELTGHLTLLMGPIMLAVAGAVFIARLFESRSIYSGRIHSGRAAAAQREEYAPSISSAARYFELMHTLLRMGARPRPLLVLDERGEPIGEIPPDRIRSPDECHRPLETATARDFAEER